MAEPMHKKEGFFQGQYFCVAKEKFPKDMYDVLLSRNKKPLELQDIANIRFVDVKEVKDGRKKYLYGQVVFQAEFEDFVYDVKGFELQKTYMKKTVSHVLPFLLELDGNIILFFKKDDAEKFGRRILSHISFGNEDTITNLMFDIKKIKEAKKKGVFENIWMNSVGSQGNIRRQRQYGENIDDDPRYLNDASYSERGVGVMVKPHINDKIKVSVYPGGSISILRSYKKFEDNVKLYFSMLRQFLPYSNYALIISSAS